MLVEMDKGMLASLVRGTDPTYEIMDDQLIKTKGYYCGGHSDRWIWNHGFESNCTEEDLWATYQLLKNPKEKRKHKLNLSPTITGTRESVINSLQAVEGVTFVQIEEHFDMTVSISVTGGKDEEIAYALYMSLPVWVGRVGLKGDYMVRTTQHGFEHRYRINRK